MTWQTCRGQAKVSWGWLVGGLVLVGNNRTWPGLRTWWVGAWDRIADTAGSGAVKVPCGGTTECSHSCGLETCGFGMVGP